MTVILVGWSGVGRTAFVNRLVAFRYDTTVYIGEVEEITAPFLFGLGDLAYPCVVCQF